MSRGVVPVARARTLVPLWIAFAALWIVLDVVVPLRHLPTTGGDFRAYHEAARALAAGVSPYREAEFTYPPLLPVLLLPLAPLSIETARLVWFVLSQAAILGAMAVTLRFLGGGAAAQIAVLAVWIVGGTVPENLVLGQLNPLLVLLLAIAISSGERRPAASAAAVGVAAALKLWPGLLLLVFAWRRRWRALAIGIATASVLVLLAAVLVALLVEESGAAGGDRQLPFGSAAPLNVSLPGLALRLADPPRGGELPASWLAGASVVGWEPWSRHGWIAAAVAAATVIAVAGALAWRRASPPTGDPRLGMALDLGALTAAAVLAAPVGWYHFQLCQFPLFAVVIERRLAAGQRRAALMVILMLAALTRLPTWGFGLYVERFGWTAQAPAALWLATSIGPVLALLWLGFAIREARRQDHAGADGGAIRSPGPDRPSTSA